MNKEKSAQARPDRIWKWMASVKLTFILLLLLAATSIIGTVIPQNLNPAV